MDVPLSVFSVLTPSVSSALPLTCRLYATFVMYGCVREELQAMKEGLNDVIPPELLAGLTAEVRHHFVSP